MEIFFSCCIWGEEPSLITECFLGEDDSGVPGKDDNVATSGTLSVDNRGCAG